MSVNSVTAPVGPSFCLLLDEYSPDEKHPHLAIMTSTFTGARLSQYIQPVSQYTTA